MRTRSTMLTGALCGALALTAHGALAADYPVLRGSQFDDPPPSREIAAELDWSGFYVGGGVGTSRTEFSPEATGLQVPYLNLNSRLQLEQRYSMAPFSRFRTANDSGINFNGFTGYNFRFGDVVLGVEGDYTKLDHRYDILPTRVALTSTIGLPQRNGVVTGQQTLHDYASLRLRMGYTMGRLMPFATFGLAAGRGTTLLTVAEDPAGLIATTSLRDKNRYIYGLTAGLGMEAALTQNVFVRAEYLFTRFDSFEGTYVDINNVRVGAGLKF